MGLTSGHASGMCTIEEVGVYLVLGGCHESSLQPTRVRVNYLCIQCRIHTVIELLDELYDDYRMLDLEAFITNVVRRIIPARSR